MKKLLFIFFSFTFFKCKRYTKAFLVAVYDKNRVENVQHKIKPIFNIEVKFSSKLP